MSSETGRRIKTLADRRAEEHRRSDRDDIISSPRYTDQLINAHPDTVRTLGKADRRVRRVNNDR